jgi:cytochrome P450
VGLSDFATEKPWRPPSLLLEADPPEHTRARHVVNKVLSAKVMRELHEQFAADADRMVRQAVEARTIDGVRDLAERYPLQVFPDVVGLPRGNRANLIAYGAMVFNGFGPRNRLFESAMAGGAAVREWITASCARNALSDEGLGARLYATAADEGFTEDEAAMLMRSFLSAGVDTTVRALGNALFCLAEHPAQWQKLRADPSLARDAFEEVLRFESPVQTFFRTTTIDADLGGVAIPKGQKLLLLLGAANRDPRAWENPDQFDITRLAAGHVAFGSGIHACVGQMMARLEGELVLSALARQVESIELAGPPVRHLNNTLRGLDALPLNLTPISSRNQRPC